MIACDTNVLVRFLVSDDPEQTRLAFELFSRATADERVFIGTVVLVETWWVTTRAYGISVEQVSGVFERLCHASTVTVEARSAVMRALEAARSGADFADALIAITASRAGSTHTVTFDRRAVKGAGMTLLDDRFLNR